MNERTFAIGDQVYERELMRFGVVVRVISAGLTMWYAVQFSRHDTVPCQAETLELERAGTPEECQRVREQQAALVAQYCPA